MATEQIVPQDIQEDADRLFNPKHDIGKFMHSSYIKGRMDERAISWTDEDMIQAFFAGREHDWMGNSGIEYSNNEETWLTKYKQSKNK